MTYGWSYGANGFLNNTPTSGAQGYVALTRVGSGFFSARWDGRGNGNVEGRLYSHGSAPAGNEFQLNSTVANHQSDPSLARLADGRILLASTDDSSSATAGDVRVRLFSAAGRPGPGIRLAWIGPQPDPPLRDTPGGETTVRALRSDVEAGRLTRGDSAQLQSFTATHRP